MKLDKLKLTGALLGFTVFLIPFYIIRFNLFGIPTNLFEILVLVILLISLVVLKKGVGSTNLLSGIHPEYRKLFVTIIGAIVAAAIIGAWQADFSLDALGIVKSWVVVPILLAFSYQLLAVRGKEGSSTLNPLYNVYLGLYASMLVVSVWALLQRLGIITTLLYQVGDPSFNQYLGTHFRAFGPFESPNYLAMFIVPAALLSAGLNLKFKIKNLKLMKGAFYISFLLPLLALVFSGSRAGIIAFVGSVIISGSVYIYHKLIANDADGSKKQFRKFILLGYSIVYLLLAVAGYFLIRNYFVNSTSDPIRFEIYRNAWQLVKHNWLTGIGLGRFQDAISTLPMTDSFRQYGYPYALHPHDLYFALWLNLGLLGMVSFVSLSIWSAINLFKSKSGLSYLVLAALLAVLIHGIFDTTYFKNDLSVIYWLIIALAI